MTERGERAAWVGLFVGACALALTVDVALGRFSTPERWEYSSIARNVLEGRGWYYEYFGARYHFYGPPLYPALLVVAMWFGPSGEALVLILQALAFATTALVVAALARHVAGVPAALVAGVLVATHPGALVYAAKLHSQTLDALLIAIAFLLVLRLEADTGARMALGCGVAVGLAVLSRGPVAPFFAVWAVWFLARERRRWSRALRVTLLVALGGVVVVVPVIARGYAMYGSVIPLRTDTGANLWYGNHPGASGTSYTADATPRPVTTQIPHDLAAALAGRDEFAQNGLFVAAATRFICESPGSALRLFANKLGYFWWFSPHAGLLYPAHWLAAYTVYYSVMLVSAGVGLVASLRSVLPMPRRAAGLFLLLAVTMSATQAVFYVEGRHRWQLELLLLAFTAAGLAFTRSQTDGAPHT